MKKKQEALKSSKGKLYKLKGGPFDGLELRLGQGLPVAKDMPPRLIPLPEEVPMGGGVYVQWFEDGKLVYRWKTDLQRLNLLV